MKVVVPYAGRVHPIADRALEEFAPEADRIDVSGDDYAYRRLLGELWEAGESFLIVEHDVEVNAEALAEVRSCGCTWGANPYRHGRGGLLREALGFTRFSAGLLAAFPDALARSDAVETEEPNWLHLDGRLHTVLVAAGYTPHVHQAEVRHHHWWSDADAERCTCGDGARREPCLTRRHHLHARACNCDGIDRSWHTLLPPPQVISVYGNGPTLDSTVR